MRRTMTVELAGTSIELALHFDAASAITQKVADLLFIAREASVEAHMQSMGLPYTPKWMPDINNVPAILHIGHSTNGGAMTLQEIQALAFENGLIASRDLAMEYIGALVTPQGQEKPETDGKDAAPGE